MVAGSRLFEGHTGAVRSVAFSPDGRRAVSSSEDGTIRFSEIDLPSDVPRQQFANSSWLKDGWIVDSGSELILWVPPWLRRGLYYPHNSLIIPTDGTAKLDFSRFVHGTSWQECIDPNVRIN
ncbi:hypothetical protein C8F04DRAFT_1098622 [Mycena alexandri]|uniref:Uncharacterized protein n=1 Tax=Mycena alexandri TaxID=1745969 RepID=A0AAD6X1C0_9AGAR|nr:hypothetical protein C8F04DRAFT_1098622 [Mycena alexandri]